MKNSPKFHSSGFFILISINVGDDALENFYCATERNSEKTKKISPLEVNAKVVDDRKLRTFEASVAFFFFQSTLLLQNFQNHMIRVTDGEKQCLALLRATKCISDVVD